MFRIRLRSRMWIPAMGMLMAGCGNLPEVITEKVRESAKEVVDEQIDVLLQELLDQLLESTDLIPLPLESDEAE